MIFLTTSLPSAASTLEVDLTTAPFSLAAGEQLILVINDLTVSVDDRWVGIRCSTDGGSTFDAGTNYQYQHYSSVGATPVSNGNSATGAMYFSSPSAAEGLGNATNESMSGEFVFYNLVDTRWARMVGHAAYEWPSGSMCQADATGTHKSTSAVTDLEISAESGTFSGTFYWYKRKIA